MDGSVKEERMGASLLNLLEVLAPLFGILVTLFFLLFYLFIPLSIPSSPLFSSSPRVRMWTRTSPSRRTPACTAPRSGRTAPAASRRTSEGGPPRRRRRVNSTCHVVFQPNYTCYILQHFACEGSCVHVSLTFWILDWMFKCLCKPPLFSFR